MKAIIFTSLVMLVCPSVQALSRATTAELNDAKDAAVAELRDLNTEFHITIRERVASETNAAGAPADAAESAALLAGAAPSADHATLAEVETLPGAEVASPWVLAAPKTSVDVFDGEDAGTFETAQLLPSNRQSN
jgi:hypothetical protein